MPRCYAVDWMLSKLLEHLVLSLCACMQGTESWERRLVEARHEHGLLEWELGQGRTAHQIPPSSSCAVPCQASRLCCVLRRKSVQGSSSWPKQGL